MAGAVTTAGRADTRGTKIRKAAKPGKPGVLKTALAVGVKTSRRVTASAKQIPGVASELADVRRELKKLNADAQRLLLRLR